MPRAPRVPSPTGLYHVTSRAIRPLQLFADFYDVAVFRHALARAHVEDGLRLYSYCLMGTHFHLIAGAEPEPLSRALGRLKGWCAQELNRRRGRSGPIFDKRFAARALGSESHVAAALIYLAVNPVRAGLVEQADTWPYGSHRAHADLEPLPRWLEPVEGLMIYDGSSYREAVDAAARRIRQGLAVRPDPSGTTSPSRRACGA